MLKLKIYLLGFILMTGKFFISIDCFFSLILLVVRDIQAAEDFLENKTNFPHSILPSKQMNSLIHSKKDSNGLISNPHNKRRIIPLVSLTQYVFVSLKK